LPEIVVYVWEGQNCGDLCVVIGRHDACWSIWGQFYSETCEFTFPRQADGSLSVSVVVDRDAGRTDVFPFSLRKHAFSGKQ
jgi:hypothetical protein